MTEQSERECICEEKGIGKPRWTIDCPVHGQPKRKGQREWWAFPEDMENLWTREFAEEHGWPTHSVTRLVEASALEAAESRAEEAERARQAERSGRKQAERERDELRAERTDAERVAWELGEQYRDALARAERAESRADRLEGVLRSAREFIFSITNGKPSLVLERIDAVLKEGSSPNSTDDRR